MGVLIGALFLLRPAHHDQTDRRDSGLAGVAVLTQTGPAAMTPACCWARRLPDRHRLLRTGRFPNAALDNRPGRAGQQAGGNGQPIGRGRLAAAVFALTLGSAILQLGQPWRVGGNGGLRLHLHRVRVHTYFRLIADIGPSNR